MTTKGKAGLWISIILLVGLSVFVYIKFYFVYSEGVNEGDINYFQKEGFVFKTYEGKMIQTGYNSKNTSATIQSNEFRFSVDDARVAEQIQSGSTSQIKLHWHRYLGTLPWRGKSEYIVDSIISVRPASSMPRRDDILNLPVD